MNQTYKLISNVAAIAGDRILLVCYAGMPDHQQGWFLPHTPVEYLEHPEDAALRAVAAQIGLDGEIQASELRLRDVESFQGNDGSWHLIFNFTLDLERAAPPRSSDLFTAYEWFPLDALPSREEVAHHGWAIDIIEGIVSSQ